MSEKTTDFRDKNNKISISKPVSYGKNNMKKYIIG